MTTPFIPDSFAITDVYSTPCSFDPRKRYAVSDAMRTTAHRAWCMCWLPALIEAAHPLLADLASAADHAALLAGDSPARSAFADADLDTAVHAVAWDGAAELPEYTALRAAHKTVHDALWVLENEMDDCAPWAYEQMRGLLDPHNDGDVTAGTGPRLRSDGE